MKILNSVKQLAKTALPKFSNCIWHFGITNYEPTRSGVFVTWLI